MAASPRFRLFAWAILAMAVVLGSSESAGAHPEVDRASAHIERAEFDAALGVLEELEKAGSLQRRDVLRLFEQKALVHLALGRRADAERSLRLLAALAPEHRFAPNTTPDLVTAFEAVRRGAPPAIRLAVRSEPVKEGLVLRARLTGDSGGLVRGMLLRVRVNAEKPRSVSGETTTVLLAAGDRVEFSAEARGVWGTLLETPKETYTARRPERAGVSPWWYVAGGALVAVAAVASVVLLSAESDRTQPGRPSLEGR